MKTATLERLTGGIQVAGKPTIPNSGYAFSHQLVYCLIRRERIHHSAGDALSDINEHKEMNPIFKIAFFTTENSIKHRRRHRLKLFFFKKLLNSWKHFHKKKR